MQFDIVANDKASATMGNVEKSMEKFGKGMGSKLSFIAGRAAILIATFQKVAQVINEGGAAADEAARLGLSVETYQKLKFAAEDYGSSIEEIAKAQKDVNKLLDAAATKKSGPEMETLQALGFSDSDIINRNIKQAEVFERIGEAIKGATSEEEKFAIASRVFGDKISTSLVPVLEDYEKFNELQARTVTISQKSADNLDRLGTKLNGFWQFTKALANEGLGKVAGFLEDKEPTLAARPDPQRDERRRNMKDALLKVGGKDASKGGKEGEVSGMAAIGGASFRGLAAVAGRPIEEQQLDALNTIAANTTPAGAPAPMPGAIDMTKGTTVDLGLGITTVTSTNVMSRGLGIINRSPRPSR